MRPAGPTVPRGPAIQNPECLLALFQRLPEDLRARAACACRQWRLARSSHKLLPYLNLGETSGLGKPVTPALLATLCRQRGTQLVALDISECTLLDPRSVIAAVSFTPNLSELRMPNIGPEGATKWSWIEVRDLFAAAPRLKATELDVENEQEILDRRVRPHERDITALIAALTEPAAPTDADALRASTCLCQGGCHFR